MSRLSEGERRLAAIMFTDMVGYMALTQTDESRAMEVLERHNRLLRPFFPRFQGREVKAIGDSFLVEFDSALNAIRCAVDMQSFLHDYNVSSTDSWKIKLRIGIHLGDVIHKAGDVFGETVNIASRLEPIANPEGICVSRQVCDQVQNKFELLLISLGAKVVKSLEQPVEVYSVEMPWEEKTWHSALSPNRIAVLPFANISPDPSDDYFADGLTEELIGKLSQVGGLEVIARTSVMSFKKQEKKVSEIARELRVGTILEGSVRKADNRIRVTVQLVNADSEAHLWSSNYDRDLHDIFALQSDIASRVAQSVPASLITTKLTRAQEKETEDITAYTYFLQGRHLLHDVNETSLREGLSYFKRAVEIDPLFARAYVGIAESYLWLGQRGMEPFLDSIEQAKAMLKKALQLEEELPEAHSTLAFINLGEDNLAASQVEAERAIQLNPNGPVGYWVMGVVRAIKGDLRESVRFFEKGHQLDPLEPNLVGGLARDYFYLGRETEAKQLWDSTVRLFPSQTYSQMIEYYLAKGFYEEAAQTIAELEKIEPSSAWTISWSAYLAALQGDNNKALSMIGRLQDVSRGASATASLVGFVRYALGDLDSFFECMSRASEMHALPVILLRFSPLFRAIREDPRFQRFFLELR